MARITPWLLGTALLAAGAHPAAAQNGSIVTAGSAEVDAEGESSYRWIDRAHALWDTLGDAPPDVSFRFDGGAPVAWELRDGYWVVAEDQSEGARTYFFAPGERGPFLVREADRSFGYQDGNVAAVYDGGGKLLPRGAGVRSVDEGERLYERGRRLRDALLDRQWDAVDTTSWGDMNLFFVGIDPGWDSGWQYRSTGFEFAQQQRWAAERARRAAMASAFARWRSGGFNGPPPPGLGQHWQHRPPRPGRPPHAGPPPAGGQPASPPGTGKPGRPWMWGGLPGQRPDRPDRPDRPQGGTRPAPPPGTVTTTPGPGAVTSGQPLARGAPNWGAGRPRPDGWTARPPRGDGDGRPGWQGPRPGWQGSRPSAGAPQPASPPVAAPAPAAPAPAAPANAGPRRGSGWMSPGWMRQARPEGAGLQPPRPAFQPPAAHPAAAPSRPAPPPGATPTPRSLPPAVRARREARGD
ncbi:hypothetical protein SAMN03159338_1186 [Sphingomonas sp. NFR04]|uniref:hypothetical protein n=1 Tax=Sphingomonas sp. NFR04 TaxID=1566283 RepID=UPI0008E7F484|nr:hypothetical protein [Sphingomonas sp. NFR04]SFJ24745.1 hypothetical protein SAMN03159338_1186 [Sphingomonas sp. NFR04]